MIHIKMPFGYNSIIFDHTFVLHTGKIRVKSSIGDCFHALGHHPQLLLQEGSNGCTTIRFSTTCQQTNDFLIKEINAMLAKIMHERIDAKYAPKKWEPEMVDMRDFLAM
jgi:hypothetical protein